MSRASALMIVNPSAGLERTRRLGALLARCLKARGLDLELRMTSASDAAADAARAAVESGCERVIVVGGDGTVNSVVGALAYTRAVLGVIPTGMANAFARELGIPLAWQAACDIAVGRHQRVLDAARVGGRHFALMAGIGFDAEVVARLNPRLKRCMGPTAYVLAALGCAPRLRPARARLWWDEGELDCRILMIVVANTAHYTYQWRLAPRARADDGLLEVVIFGWRKTLDPLAHVAGALAGRHTRHRGVVVLRTRRLWVECEPPLPLQVDGDPAGVTPAVVEILPRALKVLAPLRTDDVPAPRARHTS